MVSTPRLKRIAAVGARFLTVGAISTVIEIAVFNLLFLVLGWDVVVAKVVASLVALVNAYFGNREWTFRGRDRGHRGVEIALFVGANLVCTVLGAAIVWAGVWFAGVLLGTQPGAIAVNIVNLFSIGVIVIVRFALYHWVVFRHPTPPRPAAPRVDPTHPETPPQTTAR